MVFPNVFALQSASGSFGRDHSRRDGEPERKRIRSEIGSSYKEVILR